MTEQTCKDRIKEHLYSRISDLKILWNLYNSGNDESDPDLGTFNEYGLCFDYVAPNTFNHQRKGYFRYQLSWGGPSDEFRFYVDENFNITKIEYAFLDWFDGATKELTGKNFELMEEIYNFFKEIGSVESEYEKAIDE